MPLNINQEFRFSYNSSYVRRQLIYLLTWSFAGLFLIFLTPHFFIVYIAPIIGFSLFIYLLWGYKQPYLIINNHRLSYGTFYKTVIDLRTARRITNFGKDYIIKTKNRSYTLRSNCLEESEYPLLHDFLIQYTNAQEIIFP